MRLGSSFDAQDVCQHVFLRLIERKRMANDFHDSQHEKAWVIRTTLNAITDLQRNAWNTKVEPLGDDATNETIDPIDACINEPLSDRDVLDAVNALAPAYREAIYLYYYEGYTSRQIAELTGTTPDAVNTRLSRARAKLRGILEGEAS